MYLVAAVSFNNDILNTTNVSLTSLHPETHSIDSSIKRRNSTMKPLHSKETEAKKMTKISRQIIKEHRWHSTSLMYAIFHILTVVWHNVSPLMVVFWDHRVVAIVRARNKKKRKKKKEKKQDVIKGKRKEGKRKVRCPAISRTTELDDSYESTHNASGLSGTRNYRFGDANKLAGRYL